MSEQQNNTTTQQVATGETQKPQKNNLIFSLIVLVVFFVGYQIINTASPSTAQKKAERYVQNQVQATVGVVPVSESKVIYKNSDYYLVGVKYALTKEDLKNSHWGRVVCCFKRNGEVFNATGDLSSVNVFKLKKDELEQIKVFFRIG